MAIEDVAAATPEKVHKLRVNPLKGLDPADLKKIAKDLDLVDQESEIMDIFSKIYKCFQDRDCDLIEVNPMLKTK